MLPNTFIERAHSRHWLFFLLREVATFSSDVSNASPSPAPDSAPEASDFIRKAIREDLAGGRFERVQTRWPPEPNGYIGIGHAKAITLNFDVAREFGGFCSLRFDDTNPEREKLEYVESIKEDIRWLGFDWGEHEYYASDYYERLYELAEQLVEQGDAYVDSLTAEQISEYRGVPTRPGRESPDRERPPAESLDLLRRMRAGEFADGAYVLRARIDMASPNLNLRDPVMYRIRRVRHYRTGDAWCIYPMYDWAHGQSDSIEGVTHSLCSLEFENNRPLYDWYLDKLGIFHSRQIEFNHLNVGFAVLHKRILRRLVADGTVHGWDDPRLLTLRGMRRRGYTPSAIRAFVRSVGLTKTTVLISYAQLEYYLREELNRTATRVMAVLDPLRVVITNYPEGHSEQVEVENNPEDRGRRHAPAAVQPRTVYRTQRLHGAGAAQVLPPVTGPRGASEGRLLHHLRRGGEGWRRTGHRAALQLRSRIARRRHRRRPPGARDAALGIRRARPHRRGAPVRSPVHHREHERGGAR